VDLSKLSDAIAATWTCLIVESGAVLLIAAIAVLAGLPRRTPTIRGDQRHRRTSSRLLQSYRIAELEAGAQRAHQRLRARGATEDLDPARVAGGRALDEEPAGVVDRLHAREHGVELGRELRRGDADVRNRRGPEREHLVDGGRPRAGWTKSEQLGQRDQVLTLRRRQQPALARLVVLVERRDVADERVQLEENVPEGSRSSRR